MKLRLVPARQGALWVGQGFRIFKRQPLGYTALFFLFLFGAFVLASLPGIGVPTLLVLMPAVSLAFMIATRTALAGQVPLPSSFIAPFKGDARRARAQLRLGVAHALAYTLAMLLAGWLGGGDLAAVQEAVSGAGGGAADARLTIDPGALAIRLALTLPVTLLFWHAPALIHWGGTTPMQSIFYSAVACWRNLGAFAVYFLSWGAVVLLFSLALSLAIGLSGLPQLTVLAVPAGLLFTVAFYASLFFTFADCFEPDTPAAQEPAAQDD